MNKVNDKEYIPLTPFKGWVLENFPFIEADFDAITNYQLMCKVTEYLNGVIANQNTVQDLGTELVNAYNGLVDYVNNYFNNLDVQEEINNKLDEMTINGTLTTIIKNYVDPIQEDFEESINATIALQNQNITNISNRVLQVANGSPLSASSTAGMTDTTRIYVNTTDGHWYYYNGSVWTDGGTYQATEINDESVTPEKTNFLVLNSDNLFKIQNESSGGFEASFDYNTQKTTFTGSVGSSQRQLIMTSYLTAGNYAFKTFDETGTKPPIYLYDVTHYNNQDWNNYVGFLAGGNYGANFTVETDGTYYFCVYLQKDNVFNYQGKIVLKETSTYLNITEYIPISYDFKSFINQTMTQATNKINNYLNINYWKNKDCLLYGDSLTAWGSWGSYLSNQFGLNITNKGIAGSTAVYNTGYEGSDATHSGSADLRLAALPSNNDLIIVMFGTNDYLQNYQMGTIPKTFNTTDTFDTSKFAGSMLKILKYLYTNNPDARIIVMCPPWNHYQTNGSGLTLRDIGDVIKDVCRLTSTPYIDLFNDLNTNAINFSNYYTDAGTHLNNDGYMRVASLLKEKIEELTPIYSEE